MSTIAAVRPTPLAIGRTLLVGLLAGLAAGIANVIVFLITGALFNLPYLVPMGGPTAPPVPLPAIAIVFACVVPALLASVLYWALRRFTGRADLIFTVAAVAFTIISIPPPFLLPIDMGTRLALAFMHLVAAPIITLGLLRYAKK